MSRSATARDSIRTIPKTSSHISDASATPRSSSAIEPPDERFLRNAAIVDQERINAHPVAVVGVGAIGSHLAEMLAKLGVMRMTLIDPDEVDTVNLSVQGFYEAEVGLDKAHAIGNRVDAIDSAIEVSCLHAEYDKSRIPDGSVVFSCVDSMQVRRRIFRDFRERDWPVFLDGRMAAESLRVFCIDRSPEAIDLYRASLFPSHEAHRESCTARATIYCASMAAAILCAQFKKWVMNQAPEPHIQMDLLSMDCFR